MSALTNLRISSSYGRLVQIITGSFYDGLGNPIVVTISGSVSSSISASYASTASYVQNAITSVGGIGNSPNSSGSTIIGNTLYLQPASSSTGGIISNTTQTLGSGLKTFGSTISLNGAAATATWFINGGVIDSTGFARITFTNSNTGSGAGVGALYNNDGGKFFQYFMGSEAGAFGPSTAIIRTTGTNGIKFHHDVVGSKIRWGISTLGSLESNVYMVWNNVSMSHTGIPSLLDSNKLLGYTTGSGEFSQIVLGNGLSLISGTLENTIPQISQSRVTSQFDKTSDTTFADITGLSLTLETGKVYEFISRLYTISNSSGGIKFSVSGTVTPTSIIYAVNVSNGNSPTTIMGSSLGTAVGQITATIPSGSYTILTGTIDVNTGGTLTIQFAQNSSFATASSVIIGSTFNAIEIT